MKRKKYGNGSQGVGSIRDYMQSPSEVLAENNIDMAKAKAEVASDPFTNIMSVLGNMSMQAGMQMGGSGNKFADATMMGTANMSFANGGVAPAIPINAEGGEVIETPGGHVKELTGPKHSNGGIDLSVPGGTEIFSDRIKIKGLTMAERKKLREAKIEKLDKRLSKDSTDKATRNTNERMKLSLEKEEEQDMMVQQLASLYEGTKQVIGQVQQYSGGGIVPPYAKGFDATMFAPYFEQLKQKLGKKDWKGLDDEATRKDFQTTVGTTSDGILGKDSLAAMKATPDYMEYSKAGNTFNLNPEAPNMLPTVQEKLPPGIVADPNWVKGDATKSTSVENDPEGFSPTAGDYTAILGDLYSAFAPMQNTLNSRATDTANINPFAEFGKDALAANDSSMNYIAGQRDNNLKRVADNAQASKKRGRNNARGINSMRASDLAVDMGVNDAEGEIFNNFSNVMLKLFSQKSDLENTQDQMVMGGEQMRDANDRADKDNYYTQMSKDIASKGEGIQQIGKDLNAAQLNDQNMKLIQEFSKHFNIDKDGKLSNKVTTTQEAPKTLEEYLASLQVAQ